MLDLVKNADGSTQNDVDGKPFTYPGVRQRPKTVADLRPSPHQRSGDGGRLPAGDRRQARFRRPTAAVM